MADPATRLEQIESLTAAALAGQATGNPAFDGLALVAAECAIPHRFVRDLVDGFALDARGWHPATEADLLTYCYHVAGAVGCMMAVVMGVDPSDATLDRACDLGIAFQLANIARDIAEDEAAGRCYLPDSWKAEQSCRADMGHKLATMAAAYEASARHGTPALPFRAAWAVLAAAGIYGGIARAVARLGAAAWDDRVRTSLPEKLGWTVAAYWQAARRARLYPPAQRDPALWIRPRTLP